MRGCQVPGHPLRGTWGTRFSVLQIHSLTGPSSKFESRLVAAMLPGAIEVGEKAAGIVGDENAFMVTALIEEELLDCAVVEDVVAENCVPQRAVNDLSLIHI